MTTKEETKPININRQTQLEGAVLLSLAILLIYIGFALDGITEYGHHAMLILGGMAIGVGIGKLKHD